MLLLVHKITEMQSMVTVLLFLMFPVHFLGGGDRVDCIIKYVCQHVTQKLSLLGVHFHN